MENNEGTIEAYKYSNRNTSTKAELDAYDYAAIREQYIKDRIAKAEERGFKIGYERREIEIVIGTNKIGLPKEKIAEALDIPIEKVIQIIENHERGS